MQPLERLRLTTLSCLAAAGTLGLGSVGWTQTNVLLIVADDLGVDSLGMYQEASDYPVTPALDGLYESGVLFRNCWSNPNCSPSRAAIMTGRYGFRTGVGDHIPEGLGYALPPSETTLPEMLHLPALPYSCGAFGKWHLGNDNVGGWLAPNVAGFDHFDGSYRDSFEVPPPPNWINYFNWPRIVDGTYSIANFSYATTINVNAALEWIGQQSSPWFCNLWFHAPHEPFHRPPPALYVEDLTGLDPTVTPRPFYKAAIEAMDAEIGRLLTGISAELPNTLVIFLGDNGTPGQVAIAPFNANRAKGSIYEGGINVPLILSGPQVLQPETECQALVNISDLYATLAEVAGVNLATAQPNTKLDSVSLLPYLTDPATPSIRSWVFAERFKPNGIPEAASLPVPGAGGPAQAGVVYESAPPLGSPRQHVASRRISRAVRDARYKLIVDGTTQFYDLQLDPFETANLLDSGLDTQEQASFDTLASVMRSLLLHP